MSRLLSTVKRHRKGLLLGLALLLVAYLLPPLPREYRDLKANNSLVLSDREGVPLRRQLSSRQGVNRWVPLSEIPPELISCVLAAEDQRFYWHPGLDPLAIARAAKDNLQAGRVVSGASTLTQQLLRTLAPAEKRNLAAKLREAYWATRLEMTFSKEEIMEAYLNRVAFGPSVYGVEEAARYYFDKPSSALSLAECAVLAVTLRSPSTLDPFQYGAEEELQTWTKPLLNSLEQAGTISSEQRARAQSQPLELSAQPPPFHAPHFCDYVLQRETALRGEVRTTLDLSLQSAVEGLVDTHLALLADHRVNNAAVVVAEVKTGRILAMVGSPEYHRRGDGQHNAALSLRQPGSTLKPFTYALLLQRTGQAGFLLPDLNLYENAEEESFIPKNYDKHFHGPVSIRTALACSYNVPAVRALERVGVNNLLELLQRVGLSDLQETPEHYGLGLTLGDGSSSLLQLVRAYRALARNGKDGELHVLEGETSGPGERLLDERAAFLITDILADRQARIPSFGTPNSLELPFPCAVKTGTSKGYRDNWAVGYTPEHVVGIWVGNTDGSPMRDVSGVTGAGPLFRDVMLTLGSGGEFSQPSGLERRSVCTLSGQAAQMDCPTRTLEAKFEDLFLEPCSVCRKTEEGIAYAFPPLYLEWAEERGLPLWGQGGKGEEGLHFTFPQDQDVFQMDPDLRKDFQRVKIQVAGGSPPYRWSLDDRVLETSEAHFFWWSLRPGSHSISVTDAEGERKSISVSVRGIESDSR